MIIPPNNFEIILLYDSRIENYEITFYELVKKEISLDISDYEPSNFWGALGGMQILIDGYKLIFNSTDFFYLVKVTNFLMHSLYWIKKVKSDRFYPDIDYSKDVVVRTTDRSLIRVQEADDHNLILSYTHSDLTHIRERGERYFEDVIVEKEKWISAVNCAIAEYFAIVDDILKMHPSDESNNIMIEYYNDWKAISSII